VGVQLVAPQAQEEILLESGAEVAVGFPRGGEPHHVLRIARRGEGLYRSLTTATEHLDIAARTAEVSAYSAQSEAAIARACSDAAATASSAGPRSQGWAMTQVMSVTPIAPKHKFMCPSWKFMGASGEPSE